MKPMEGHIELKNVSKIYQPGVLDVHAVDNCSLEIKPGEFVVIVGPSGCGKTTLLNMIAGFDTVTEGEIYLDGTLIAAPNRVPQPGPDRVVVFQQGALFEWQTILKNITFGPVSQGAMSKNEAIKKARELMEIAGVSGYEKDFPSGVSSGISRRIEILRALINEPKTLLLDEPYRALDAITKAVMHKFLLDVFDRTHKTIMFITHDLDEAIYLSDRVVIFTTRPGKIKKQVTVDIPRPRGIHVKATNKFLEIKREVLGTVREEAIKSFQRGEREIA